MTRDTVRPSSFPIPWFQTYRQIRRPDSAWAVGTVVRLVATATAASAAVPRTAGLSRVRAGRAMKVLRVIEKGWCPLRAGPRARAGAAFPGASGTGAVRGGHLGYMYITAISEDGPPHKGGNRIVISSSVRGG